MLYDRPYMQNQSYRTETPYLWWILGTTFGFYVLQEIMQVWLGRPYLLRDWLALGSTQLRHFKVWTPLTYALLHSGFWHMIINLAIIFFSGRILLTSMSHKSILNCYLMAVVVGGLFWLPFNFHGNVLLGASAGALGLLALSCCLRPNEPVQLMFFLLPSITVLPKWIFWFILGFNGLAFLFSELPSFLGYPATGDFSNQVAYSAHLGGIFAGWFYARLVLSPRSATGGAFGGVKIEPPAWLKRKPKSSQAGKPRFKLNMSNKEELSAEVDRILDKINEHGFGSLTPEERETLDKARDLLKR